MKICPVCQTPVVGRSDKKFCCADCRASYHNALNRSSNQKIQKINRILRRNRRILEEMLQQNLERISFNILKDKGFEFEYYTREIPEEDMKACYDISYRLVKEEKEAYVLIRSREKQKKC